VAVEALTSLFLLISLPVRLSRSSSNPSRRPLVLRSRRLLYPDLDPDLLWPTATKQRRGFELRRRPQHPAASTSPTATTQMW
jgi:hypothetical protein